MILEIANTKVSIRSTSHKFITIGNDIEFDDVLCCRIDEKEQAISDVARYYMKAFANFKKSVSGIDLSVEEHEYFHTRFVNKAKQKAKDIVDLAIEENGYIFSYLPEQL